MTHSELPAIVTLCFVISSTGQSAPAPGSLLPGGASNWKLKWSEEFDGPDAKLDERWISQNGPSGHILCSRWRENAVVKDGTLRLVNKKETRGDQNRTSGSILTKEKFLYGYFECRYRYAAAEGTNNSFWLMTQNKDKPGLVNFAKDATVNLFQRIPCLAQSRHHQVGRRGHRHHRRQVHGSGLRPGLSVEMRSATLMRSTASDPARDWTVGRQQGLAAPDSNPAKHHTTPPGGTLPEGQFRDTSRPSGSHRDVTARNYIGHRQWLPPSALPGLLCLSILSHTPTR